MEYLVAQTEKLDLQSISRFFLIISVIAFFVSFFLNTKIKFCLVLAVELSILVTLLVFPGINAYLNMATISDYEHAADVARFPDSPLIFFFPLPMCVLVSTVFYIYREKKIKASSEKLPSVRGFTSARAVAWILSATAGSLWLCIDMAFERSFEIFTVLRFFEYTIYGFAAFLVVEFLFWIVRLILVPGEEREA